jgi:hypothetical protein
MAVVNLSAEIKGSSTASVKPIRMMAVTAALSGRASSGIKGRPSVVKPKSKPTKPIT